MVGSISGSGGAIPYRETGDDVLPTTEALRLAQAIATADTSVLNQAQAYSLANINHLPALSNVDLNNLTGPTTGTGAWQASAQAGVTNFPPQLAGSPGLFEAYSATATSGWQRWVTSQLRTFERTRSGGVWGDWVERIMPEPWSRNVATIPGGAVLTTYTTPGAYVVHGSAAETISDTPFKGASYALEVIPRSTTWIFQRATNASGFVLQRQQLSAGVWTPWRPPSGVPTFASQAEAVEYEAATGLPALFVD